MAGGGLEIQLSRQSRSKKCFHLVRQKITCQTYDHRRKPPPHSPNSKGLSKQGEEEEEEDEKEEEKDDGGLTEFELERLERQADSHDD